VEDSKTDAFLIREAIGTAQIDADIQVVTDGEEALHFIDAVEVDQNAPCPALVLLDMNLPRVSGDEVLKHLRSSQRCREAAVLIVTSSDAIRDRDVTAALGIDGYFRKPSDYAEFMKLGRLVKNIL
jgi:CheY-like chemotaxis protein